MNLEHYYTKDLYRIGEVALMAGMTCEAVRYYERKGLIASAVRSQGGYRLFTVAAVKKLQDIRFYRSLGVPIQDIVTLMESPGPQQLSRVLNQRERAVYQEMERSRLMLERIRTMRKAESQRPGAYSLAWLPAYHKILSGGQNDELFDLRCNIPEEVMRDYFFAFYGGFFLPVDQTEEGISFGLCQHGFSLDPFLAADLQLPRDLLGDYVPSNLCVNTCMIFRNGVSTEELKGAFDWMGTQNLEPGGTIVGRTIASYRVQNQWIRSYDVWIPIKNAKNISA